MLLLPQSHINLHPRSLLNPFDRRLSTRETRSTENQILYKHIKNQDRHVQSHQTEKLQCNLTEGIKIAKERICHSKERLSLRQNDSQKHKF